MPLVSPSSYRAPRGFGNGHVQTVYPVLFRHVPDVDYRRERIETPDDDFLDLDWLESGRDRVAILSHGLEGDTRRPYMMAMAAALRRSGWDVLAWNCRGCSGVPNRRLRFYHSGATDDLDAVIRHALKRDCYERLALVGFSLGGNLTLKYLGERGSQIDPRVCGAVAFSVPCDLESSGRRMSERDNVLYMQRFLISLRAKIRAKAKLFPNQIHDEGYRHLRTFRDFDNRYTAPIHGFQDADDYYRQCGSVGYLRDIAVPALLVNARDDPFLAPECFPTSSARDHPHLHLETPDYGGHVGFVRFHPNGEYWSETRATTFLETLPTLGRNQGVANANVSLDARLAP